MVLIERGKVQSWILPSSLSTWEKEGWKLVKSEKASKTSRTTETENNNETK